MKKQNHADATLPRWAAWIIALLSLALLGFIAVGAFKKFEARSWPVTQGEVLDSAVWSSKAKLRYWCLKVSYQYQVADVSYRNAKVSPNHFRDEGCSSEQETVVAWRAQIKPGTRILVHHDPVSPENAVLNTGGLEAGDFLILMFAITIGVVAIKEISIAPRPG